MIPDDAPSPWGGILGLSADHSRRIAAELALAPAHMLKDIAERMRF